MKGASSTSRRWLACSSDAHANTGASAGRAATNGGSGTIAHRRALKNSSARCVLVCCSPDMSESLTESAADIGPESAPGG